MNRTTITLLVLGLLSLEGCASEGHDKFIPSEERARKALETALAAWQNGERPGKIEGVPAVQVLDFRWSAGKQLASYEIVDIEAEDEGPTWFTVRLHLKESRNGLVVRYVVVGKDPLWVYSEEYYKQAAGS